jgi:CBS domain-containing protein
MSITHARRTGGVTAGRRIDEIRVEDVMHDGVVSCDEETPLVEVARLMAQKQIHCVVVRDRIGSRGTAPWGVVSDLDLVAAAVARPLDQQTAGASAASPALLVAPSETLERAAQLMTEHATAHLIVVEPASRRPVGVLSTLDVAAALS